MSYNLNEKEMKEYNDWHNKHKCKGTYVGAIGGRESFIFTPTGLGSCIQVRCNVCKEEIDITDVSNW
jgi:hypothetical protein